jgi:hypothetical protein
MVRDAAVLFRLEYVRRNFDSEGWGEGEGRREKDGGVFYVE